MPKIIGGSLVEHRAQTRVKLFTALSSLMSARGFDAITLADVAAAAGIGRTAIYNHFADKESLLLGFITHETEQYVATLERALEGVDDPVGQLRTYVRQHAQLRTVFHLAPSTDLRSVLSPLTQARLRDHAGLVESILRRILEAGIASGAFVLRDVATTIPLVISCLGARTAPDDGSDVSIARRREILATTEEFLLRAVGASPMAATAEPAGPGDPPLVSRPGLTAEGDDARPAVASGVCPVTA